MGFESLISRTLSRSQLFTDAEYWDGAATHDIRVHLKFDVDVYRGHAVVQENHVIIPPAEISAPEPGHQVTVDGVTYELGERMADEKVFPTFQAIDTR